MYRTAKATVMRKMIEGFIEEDPTMTPAEAARQASKILEGNDNTLAYELGEAMFRTLVN